MLKLAIPLLTIALLASCKTEQDPFDRDFGFDYYPLEVGKSMIYQMDSTIYDPTGDSMLIHSTSFLKETVVDSFIDLTGTPVYRIEQYHRAADTLPWVINKVVTASITNNQAQRVEDNLRFIKLTFPVRENNSWDGNVFFDSGTKVTVAGETLEMFKSWSYRIIEKDHPESIGAFSFPEVVTVQNADSENLIELRLAHEKYARGVGLVYRELWILDTQCIEDCIGMTWEQKAEKGFILKQTLIDHN
ncbi:MAG: hypothetical protein CMN32_02665 [Saprospirales bacterium]|nr:hypothetical protein [Saprospirales bacterium]